MRKIAFRFSTTLLLLISLAAPLLAAPYPKTASDFSALPNYCKIRFNKSKYPVQYAKWRKTFGQEWTHMHHYCKGMLYLNKGKYTATDSEQANSSFSEAVKQFDYVQIRWAPNYVLAPELHVKKGQALIGLGQISQALSEFKSAIRIKSKYSAPYAALSDYYRKIGDYDLAESWLQKGISINPKSKKLKRKLLKLQNID